MDKPRLIVPSDKKLLDANGVPADKEAQEKMDAFVQQQQQDMHRIFSVTNGLLAYLSANCKNPIEAVGILSMCQSRVLGHLNADLNAPKPVSPTENTGSVPNG